MFLHFIGQGRGMRLYPCFLAKFLSMNTLPAPESRSMFVSMVSELSVCSWVGRHVDSFSTWATSTDETTKMVGADVGPGHQSKNPCYQ